MVIILGWAGLGGNFSGLCCGMMIQFLSEAFDLEEVNALLLLSARYAKIPQILTKVQITRLFCDGLFLGVGFQMKTFLTVFCVED